MESPLGSDSLLDHPEQYSWRRYYTTPPSQVLTECLSHKSALFDAVQGKYNKNFRSLFKSKDIEFATSYEMIVKQSHDAVSDCFSVLTCFSGSRTLTMEQAINILAKIKFLHVAESIDRNYTQNKKNNNKLIFLKDFSTRSNNNREKIIYTREDLKKLSETEIVNLLNEVKEIIHSLTLKVVGQLNVTEDIVINFKKQKFKLMSHIKTGRQMASLIHAMGNKTYEYKKSSILKRKRKPRIEPGRESFCEDLPERENNISESPSKKPCHKEQTTTGWETINFWIDFVNTPLSGSDNQSLLGDTLPFEGALDDHTMHLMSIYGEGAPPLQFHIDPYQFLQPTAQNVEKNL